MQFKCIRLSETEESLEEFNKHLQDGWAVVDRFELERSTVIMLKK